MLFFHILRHPLFHIISLRVLLSSSPLLSGPCDESCASRHCGIEVGRGADLGPLLVAQHVGMSESVHTPAGKKKDLSRLSPTSPSPTFTLLSR